MAGPSASMVYPSGGAAGRRASTGWMIPDGLFGGAVRTGGAVEVVVVDDVVVVSTPPTLTVASVGRFERATSAPVAAATMTRAPMPAPMRNRRRRRARRAFTNRPRCG